MRRSVRFPPLLALVLALPLSALPACESATDGPADVPAGGDESPADGVASDDGPGGFVPEGATEAQVQALAEVNRYRAASGLGPVDMAATLNQAAQAHADFIVGNCANYGTSGLSPHQENPAWDGFTGEDLGVRAQAAGFSAIGSWGIGEVIAFEHDPAAAVTGWIDTLYHRIPLLDPNARQVGYGIAALAQDQSCNFQYRNADVMEIVSVFPGIDAVVLYPPDGARRVPTSFWGREVPQPPRPPAGWPSGSIITVHFGSDLPFQVTDHRLLGPDGADLQHYIMARTADPDAGVAADPFLHDDRVLALYGLQRLAAGNTHTVILDVVRDGAPLHLEWSFRTDNVPNN